MKTSARNQFSGTVLAVKTGAVNSEISIGLPGGQTLTATVTNESCQELALAQGRAVIALVKSSHIIVATDLAHIRLSARNQIEGIIEHIERGFEESGCCNQQHHPTHQAHWQRDRREREQVHTHTSGSGDSGDQQVGACADQRD